ncbi:MAG: DUF3726 domain-containing protein [Chloroflexota bacterium]
MKVSATELTELCQKVFEGKGFPSGDYEDCAQAITWLEMHKFPILEQIERSLPQWDLSPSRPATPLFEDETVCVLDAHQNDGLIYGSLALDLAYLKALSVGFAVVTLIRAQHCQLIIPHIVQSTRRGANIVASWCEGNQEHVITMALGEKYPYYTVTQRAAQSTSQSAGQSNSQPGSESNNQQHAQTLSILCTTNVAFSQTFPNRGSGHSPLRCITPDDFATFYQYHNEVGIEINESLWAKLVALSRNVLVESTALSRLQGAGELSGGNG